MCLGGGAIVSPLSFFGTLMTLIELIYTVLFISEHLVSRVRNTLIMMVAISPRNPKY